MAGPRKDLMRDVVKGQHDVYCFMCGRECGHATHYGGTNKLLWCEYCADIPHYCMDCYIIGRHYKNIPARKDSMFRKVKTDDQYRMMNIREFNASLHDLKPGDEVLVVDATRNKLVCLVEFKTLPDSADLVKAVKYTK